MTHSSSTSETKLSGEELYAADFHMNTEHFKRLVPAIGELLEEGEARFYSEVSF